MGISVLSVGQCGPDDFHLGRLISAELGCVMERADSGAEAARKIAEGKYDLVLVNRVFDATGESGVAFITEAKKAGGATPMMLVSDYASAQADAVTAGALMGFGKSMLRDGEVASLLRRALGWEKKSHAV